MSGDIPKQKAATKLLDRTDARVRDDSGLAGWTRALIDRVRSGDLGSLPVVVGLAIIWTVFQSLNPVFLSSNNLANLLFDSSTVGVIALGIVCILMIGEIDLSVGSVSGFASALVGVLWVNAGWPVVIAILAALVVGGAIGFVYAALFNAWHAELRLDSGRAVGGSRNAALHLGRHRLDQPAVRLAAGDARADAGDGPVGFVLCRAAGRVGGVRDRYRDASRRRAAGLSSASLSGLLARAIVLVVGLELVVHYLNRERGVPWMFTLFVFMVVALDYGLKRTQWGRSMTAVGGNREAARRAGINVPLICTSAFVLCSTLAAFGGVLSAARLASASQQAGTGDVNLNAIAAAVIGGTSLFGGRGNAYSALLGIIVIQSISSGLTLLDLSSSLRYMITGGVLAIAVIVDSLARRSRVSHGRA